MIPILYDKTETTFTSNGIGRLTDCLRCIVTEARNGIYECEFDYPISGERYDDIQEGQIIAVTHDDNGDIQPFDIYHRTAPIDGIVTFYARHISYRQIGITVEPFTASGISNAITAIGTNSFGGNPFTYSTDKTTAGDYAVKVPTSAKALLGGEEGSLLDVFGAGEYEFDKFNVHLWARRGTDTSVEIRYGKNLSDIEHDVDYSDSYNGIVPYWFGAETDENDQVVETLVMLPEVAIMASGAPYDGRDTILPLDLSGDFPEQPTASDLRTLATDKLNAANTLLPLENIRVSFVQLWQTDEYKNVAPLQKVGLCDTVSVIYPELGVGKTTIKIIKTVYNTLLDRYDEMELGEPLTSYAAIVTANDSAKISQLEDGLMIVSNAAEQAVADAASAHSAAISAQADAGDALIAAGNAVTAAGNASTAAQAAQNSANAAAASADSAALQASTANVYANSALDQLNIVQDVVGVLDLLSTNATYQLTADETVTPGKWYFTRSGYASGTETGSIVSFQTSEGNDIAVTANIDYVQSGSGTPTPSNVRPISGLAEANIYRTGANIWNEEWEVGGINTNTGAETTTAGFYRSKNYISVVPNTTYYFKSPVGMAVIFYDINKTHVSSTSTNNETFTVPQNARYMRFRNNSANTWTPYNNDISINYPSTDTSYHAYTGNVYNVSFSTAGTVYGGTLNVQTGLLTVTHAAVDMGTLSWGRYSTATSGKYRFSTTSLNSVIKKPSSNMVTGWLFCSIFGETAGNTQYNNVEGVGVQPNGSVLTYSETYASYSVEDYTTAVTGQTLVYGLDTPLTYQLTPQQVKAIEGTNYLWADTGNVTATFPSTYAYTVVTDPVDADLSTYYELVSIDESVQNYLVSKLSVTAAGLWVQEPSMQTKILLSATDGVVLYGPEGTIIGKYGSTAQIGDAAGFHIEMDGTELGFYQASRKVAYISNNQLYITQSVVLQQMDLGIAVNDGGLGQWSWKVHPNGDNPSRNNLNLKWVG